MIDSEEGGTTVFVCNRTSCKRYYNWEYFRKTVGDGFVVQNQKTRDFYQTILTSYSKYFFFKAEYLRGCFQLPPAQGKSFWFKK